MKVLKIFLALVLGASGAMCAMEEDRVVINLKEGKKAEISQEQFEGLKAVVGEVISYGLPNPPYSLEVVDTDGFEGIIDNITALKSGDPEQLKAMVITLNKDSGKLVSVIRAADYLAIDSLVSFIEKTLTEDIFEVISKEPELLKALLNPEIVQLFLPNLEKTDDRGNTPLMKAALRGKSEIVAALIDLGVDLTKRNNIGETALMKIAMGAGFEQVDGELLKIPQKEYDKTAELLIKAGADINKKDADGRTALMNAAIRGEVGIVKLLIQAGAKLEIQNKYGETALILAAVSGFRDKEREAIAQLLIDAGAYPTSNHKAVR